MNINQFFSLLSFVCLVLSFGVICIMLYREQAKQNKRVQDKWFDGRPYFYIYKKYYVLNEDSSVEVYTIRDGVINREPDLPKSYTYDWETILKYYDFDEETCTFKKKEGVDEKAMATV